MAKKNKNKIRILDSNQDLDALFADKTDNQAHNKNDNHESRKQLSIKNSEMSTQQFKDLLDLSLKGKSMNKLLQEKKERGTPQKVSLGKRLKRFPSPESRLDLHSFTSDGATMRSDSFIRTAFKRGLFTLKIIVGKGLHSKFGAVLPGVVQDLIIKLKNEGIVLHFEWEKKKKSKSGAIIVYLNQFND